MITARKIQAFKDHNRFLRKNGLPEMTLEDYMKNLSGSYKFKKKKKKTLDLTYLSRDRVEQNAPSVISFQGKYTTSKKDDKEYTGSLIKGIAVSHKSNLVPISSQEQAVEISQMRRN